MKVLNAPEGGLLLPCWVTLAKSPAHSVPQSLLMDNEAGRRLHRTLTARPSACPHTVHPKAVLTSQTQAAVTPLPRAGAWLAGGMRIE